MSCISSSNVSGVNSLNIIMYHKVVQYVNKEEIQNGVPLSLKISQVCFEVLFRQTSSGALLVYQ